ncbi:MAG: tetratricopeptide repeat protein [Acidobacteria bacterium]|nr:tetratricopeptide repeat protein [Acidobacteriota bacterium]
MTNNQPAPARGFKWWYLAVVVVLLAGAGGAYWKLSGKTYRVRVAADPGVRALDGWEAQVRGQVEGASAIFAREFGIRFKVVDVVPWSPLNAAPRLDARRLQLKEQVSHEGVDLVLGVTSGREGARRASVVPFSTTILLIEPSGDPAQNARGLAQIFGYQLGAFRNKASEGTLAGETPASDRFDAENTARIKAVRFYDLGKGLERMSPTDADQLAAALAPFPNDQGKPMGLALVRTMLGASFMADGQTEKAVLQFKNAVQGDPNLIPARYSLAVALADRRQYDEAAQTLREAARVRPGDPQILESMAWLRLRQGKDAEAIALLRVVVNVRRESPVMRMILASLMAEAPGRPDGRLTELRNLVRLNVEWSHPMRAAQMAQGLSAAAAQASASSLTPVAGGGGMLASGILLTYAGKLPEAQRAFETALRQDPKLFAGHINLTLLNFMTGNLAAARVQAAAAAAGGPPTVKAFAGAMDKLLQGEAKLVPGSAKAAPAAAK